jgi:hypothetical protein
MLEEFVTPCSSIEAHRRSRTTLRYVRCGRLHSHRYENVKSNHKNLALTVKRCQENLRY